MNKFKLYIKIIGLISIISLANNCNTKIKEKKNYISITDSTKNVVLNQLNEKILNNLNNPFLYHQRANVFLEQRDLKAAFADIERALSLDSNQADFHLTLADIYFASAKISDSKLELEKCIAINPKQIDALLKLAELHLYLEQFQKSIDFVNDALKIDKYIAKAYFLKGMNYKYIGDTINAISSMQTAIEQKQDYYEAYIQLGLLFASKNNFIAIDYYDNALRINPNSIEAYYNKSIFLQDNSEPEKAIQGYRAILKIKPDYYFAQYNIGYIYLTYIKDYQKAITYFTEAITFKNDYFEAYYNKGLCYELLKDKTKAEKLYRKALSIQPDYTLAAKGISRVVDGSKEK